MTITKEYLSRQLALRRPGLSFNKAKRALEALLRLAKQSLAEGDPLLLSGFGKFKILHKDPRQVRNPKSGDEFMLEARTVVSFKTASTLRRRLNGASRST